MFIVFILFVAALCWMIAKSRLAIEDWVREEENDLYCSLECSECDKPVHKITGAMTAPTLRNTARLNAMMTFGELHRQDR